MSSLGTWRHGFALFKGFVRREISNRYSGTLMGGVWAIGQPVLMLAIYGFVFRQVLKVQIPDLGNNSFVAFVACALWPWMAFQEAVQRGAQAVVGNADLVRKVAFPSQVLVLASVTSSFILHGVGFAFVLMALSLWGEPLSLAGVPVAILAWGVLFVLASGLALACGAMQVILKDIDHLLGPLFMLLFYVTPIVYSYSLVPDSFKRWMAANPLLYVFEPVRAGLLRGDLSMASDLLWALALGVVVLAAGQWLFVRLSNHFEDFL